MQQLLVVVRSGRRRRSSTYRLSPSTGTRWRADQRHEDVLGRLDDLPPQRAVQHLRHARVPLEDGDLRRVHRPHRNPRGQVGDGGLLDVDLAEGGQHLLDVAEERPVRPDDEDAGARELPAVRVQQVGRAVQADRGLPVPGRPAHRLGQRGPHDLVLVGLDGGDDVPHRADCATLDLRPEQRALVLVARSEQLVLVAGELPVGEAEPAAPHEALGVAALAW